MGTSNWQALEHVVDTLKQLGGIANLDAGWYEGPHKEFKKSYKQTSKR